jgi:hypothetical protein
MPQEWKNMKGFRFIFQPRYFTNKRRTFFTPEFRLKNFSFDNRLTLINHSTNDTLHSYPIRESQTVIGAALVCGEQFIISRKHDIIMELTIGIGGRTRYIKRKNLPAGYEYTPFDGFKEFYINYDANKSSTGSFPLGIRFVWNLGRK